jgi:protein ImuA
MSHALLTRQAASSRPDLTVLPQMALSLGRVHEICGPARRTLAVHVAAATTGPVIWIAPGWQAERLNGDGLCSRLDPGRMIFVDPMRGDDLLWCTEEVLRSGIVPLVVTELTTPPALTPVRRLHLAAETGGEMAGALPLGLLLTPDQGGAAGVESRWHMAPAHTGLGSLWTLSRLRARTAPPAQWQITQTAQSEEYLRLQPVPMPSNPPAPST